LEEKEAKEIQPKTTIENSRKPERVSELSIYY
jgi:hypothetical protein